MSDESHLLLIGDLEPVLGMNPAGEDGGAKPASVNGVPMAVILAGIEPSGTWWELHLRHLASLAATGPILTLSVTRPSGLPFRASWFSTPGDHPGLHHRTLSGLEHLDFVLAESTEALHALGRPLDGIRQVIFVGRSVDLGGYSVSPGSIVMRMGETSQESTEVQLLWFGPDSSVRVMPVEDLAEWLSQKGSPDCVAAGAGSSASLMQIPAAEVPVHSGFLDRVLEGAARQHGPEVAALLRKAVLGPLEPLEVTEAV